MASRTDDEALPRREANYVPLSPLSFLERAAKVYPHKVAVVHGDWRITYAELYRRCKCFASALTQAGVGPGDTVAIMAPNVPALLEAHYGVPMAGGILNTINTRLDGPAIGFGLKHSKAKVLIADRDYAKPMREALQGLDSPPLVIDIVDTATGKDGHPDSMAVGKLDYEAFLRQGDPDFAWQLPQDEWDSIALNYTSGTTGDPKGVLYHHRGAYLNAMGNALAFGLTPDTAYLWTLPMFHCNGWTYTWAVTLVGGTHVCLRTVDPAQIFSLIGSERITHLCAAPIVLNMLLHSPALPQDPYAHRVEVATGGAAPPSAVIEAMERIGFKITHLYGLTETYGPATLCAWQHDWDDLDLTARAGKMARQGVAMPTQQEIAVLDIDTGARAPADGKTVGEIAIRGNTVMKGYLHNPAATEEAFKGGWFRSGDLAVMHPDGYLEIKDRLKDIIISGGENISTLEVEEVLYRHPKVMDAAVVAKPDEKWGETPCAFVTLRAGAGEVSAEEIIKWCRASLAGFKCPKNVVFGELPKTATGKVQKNVLRERAAQL
ncbi:acyl-CoA synthetase [Variovorax sp. J22R133]|uniref:acyl-CoA synthetase n=1 Tax=Variovorax brevis TaxID=3053503 RepID=UPI002577789B|nr:acyl-CoA synthetase [Variovorax sp. J22R133]MDM0117040.1 acyl-CoA synthetase [Variovorax sp. J22R133]